ncbi:MAG: putative toxin-antitoxin system toxin component, PIN family [Polyangia bacterium]
MRVVLDTNVIVSAVVFGGKPRAVLGRCIRGQDLLVTCSALVAEIEAVLARPRFGFFEREARMITSELLQIADRAEPGLVPAVIAEDPDDDVVLACAVKGRADVIVSGDHHLKALGSYQGIPIHGATEHLDRHDA